MFKKFDLKSFGTDQLWNRIALVSGIFALLICVLLIGNYIQVKKADPINMKVINTLVERLRQEPSDSSLRHEIRTLDLLSRKAYFTTKWQIKTGGYLVLAAIAVMVIALQIISYRKKIVPVLSPENEDNTMLYRNKTRIWIITGGSLILATAFIFAILATNQLKDNFTSGEVINEATNETITEPSAQMVDSTVLAIADTSKVSIMATKDTIIPSTATKDTVATKSKAVSKDNFPTFRGPGGNGIAKQKNIPISWDGLSGTNILWKTAIPLPGYSSPIIWADKIFVTGANTAKREVYCIDRNTGAMVWAVVVENIPGSPGQAPKVIAETGHAAPTAATDGFGVYAIFSNGDIIAMDMVGKKLWAENLGMPGNHYGHSSSLMIYKDLVIVQYDQKTSPKLIALSTKTGKTVWSTNRNVKISWASPVIVNTGKRTEIILAAEPYVASYNPADGKELWKIDCISGEVGPSVAYANGMVFSVNDYSKLAAIKIGVDQPTVLWENTDYLSDIPSPVATDKYLILSTSYGLTVCYDAVTGEKYWEKEFGNNVYASPIIAEDKVYLLDKNGIMHIFKADKEYVSLGEPKLGEPSACTPAFTNGRIYLRGDKNLYCIGK
ncbi:MAG: PQQ-binding-like beta-propeller repeat protein [Salinivirgaceae bacterium]